MMRIIALMLLAFLVSCATPQSRPNSFYSKTYTPGTANISEQGSFVSVAHVVSKTDFPKARRAAFARLMEKAEDGGYLYFEITEESRKRFLGTHFVVKGQLYRKENYGSNVYPIRAIGRVLKGLPLAAPRSRPVIRSIAKPIAKRIYQAKPDGHADDCVAETNTANNEQPCSSTNTGALNTANPDKEYLKVLKQQLNE